MTLLAPAPTMTTDELLALPKDDVERWLIRGELRERPRTVRNRAHSRLTARIAQLLGNWLDHQPSPRGEVFDGEVGCRLRCAPDTTVGIDVVYVSAELAAREPEDTTLLDGVPILVVEVLSPNDTQEQIHDKIDEYLRAGVALVWIVDPRDRTVRAYRPQAAPELFNVQHELSGEPHPPGFRVSVAHLFARRRARQEMVDLTLRVRKVASRGA